MRNGVDIDDLDIGGLYERFEIFSKVSILVDEYPEEDQCYFKKLPNPDYKNTVNPRWNSYYESLGWEILNSSSYKYNL